MAYFNFSLAEEKYSLTPLDIITLQLIHQNSSSDEDNSDLIASCMTDNLLEFLETDGYITYTKTKKQNEFQRMRLSKTGKELLETIQVPEIIEDDLRIFDWISAIYTKEGKEIGNRKKTKMYIALFRAHSGIEKNALAYLIQTFINEPSNLEFSHRLEYLFFRGASVFQTKFDIEQSRLYQFYLKNKEQYDAKFEKL